MNRAEKTSESAPQVNGGVENIVYNLGTLSASLKSIPANPTSAEPGFGLSESQNTRTRSPSVNAWAGNPPTPRPTLSSEDNRQNNVPIADRAAANAFFPALGNGVSSIDTKQADANSFTTPPTFAASVKGPFFGSRPSAVGRGPPASAATFVKQQTVPETSPSAANSSTPGGMRPPSAESASRTSTPGSGRIAINVGGLRNVPPIGRVLTSSISHDRDPKVPLTVNWEDIIVRDGDDVNSEEIW